MVGSVMMRFKVSYVGIVVGSRQPCFLFEGDLPSNDIGIP